MCDRRFQILCLLKLRFLILGEKVSIFRSQIMFLLIFSTASGLLLTVAGNTKPRSLAET
ncbi:hypothetical protein Mapa_000782 [Marchantia paleacea]|nr:hypothetical protein Mapa_000782 [Marchantia paleacea]